VRKMTWEDEAAPGPSRRDSRSCPCRTDWLQWQLPCHRATLCALSWRSTPDDGAAVVPCAPRDAPPSACLLARPWGYRARLRQRGSAPPRLPRLLPARAPSCWHAAAISARRQHIVSLSPASPHAATAGTGRHGPACGALPACARPCCDLAPPLHRLLAPARSTEPGRRAPRREEMPVQLSRR
jgi:hypothetical protein